MKKSVFVLCLVFALIFTGCTKPEEPATSGAIQSDAKPLYSNLASDAVCDELDEVMKNAGVSDARRESFWNHVKLFNDTVSPESLVGEFEVLETSEPKYDVFTMQDEWMAKHPDFLGYNCRITSYSLFGDYLDIPTGKEANLEMVVFDLAALEEDSSALPNDGDLNRFTTFYSTVKAKNTKNVDIHAETMTSYWKNRGITFKEHPQMSLITVIFHDAWEGECHLFVGHTGILFPTEGGLYFVEKIAFQEPYQVTIFESRASLRSYLMEKYDTSFNQPTAPPFIMENNKMMED